MKRWCHLSNDKSYDSEDCAVEAELSHMVKTAESPIWCVGNIRPRICIKVRQILTNSQGVYIFSNIMITCM